MAQRVGPVTIDENFEDDDLTVILVPSEAVGFVTGSQGNFLRQVEEEWGTLMFFADFRGRGERKEVNAAASLPSAATPPLAPESAQAMNAAQSSTFECRTARLPPRWGRRGPRVARVAGRGRSRSAG